MVRRAVVAGYFDGQTSPMSGEARLPDVAVPNVVGHRRGVGRGEVEVRAVGGWWLVVGRWWVGHDLRGNG
ncbi:MAG: hypothetical protein ACRDZY_04375 [Acidimicrobiales bacterium]